MGLDTCSAADSLLPRLVSGNRIAVEHAWNLRGSVPPDLAIAIFTTFKELTQLSRYYFILSSLDRAAIPPLAEGLEYWLALGLRFENSGIISMVIHEISRLTMKPIAHASLATGLSLLLLVASFSIHQVSAADENTRIETEQEFREIAIGKKLVYNKGALTVHDDGTMTGTHGGKKVTGTWSWEDEYYCRSVKVGKKDIGHDCQVVELSGNSLIFIRKKGTGKKSPPYQIEAES